MLSTSNRQLEDEKRNIERVIEKGRKQKEVLEQNIHELGLENQMAQNDLNRVKKQKEKKLVKHDQMKLEIKGISDRV